MQSGREMSDTGSCEVKRIQMNSAQSTLDQAQQGFDQSRSDYLVCQGPQAQGSAALGDAQDTILKLTRESEELFRMNEVILQMLSREVQAQGAVGGVTEIAMEQATAMENEIDALKTAIRTEKRKFLDASPSVSPAVGGMYYTKTPDNKALIAFLIAFGAFLLFASLLVILNAVPVAYFQNMTSGDRYKLVGIMWAVALIAGYAGFYIFT